MIKPVLKLRGDPPGSDGESPDKIPVQPGDREEGTGRRKNLVADIKMNNRRRKKKGGKISLRPPQSKLAIVPGKRIKSELKKQNTARPQQK